VENLSSARETEGGKFCRSHYHNLFQHSHFSLKQMHEWMENDNGSPRTEGEAPCPVQARGLDFAIDSSRIYVLGHESGGKFSTQRIEHKLEYY
jgi:hypothetical protein